MGESGFASEPPVTVDQMFKTAVERFGSYTALGWKEGEQMKTMNYQEYYQACRTAAKSFLKVRLNTQTNCTYGNQTITDTTAVNVDVRTKLR